ncbi:MAG: hypothetical protein WC379_00800 [Methanoregula sp.]
MDYSVSKTRDWYRLLPVILGVILLVQAGSAYVYHFQLDQSVSPQEIHLGDSVTMKFHVYDTQHGIGFAGAPVTVTIYRTAPPAQIKIVTLTTNASGWATYTYTPQEIAKFSFNSASSYNYSTFTGLPPVGMQSSGGDPGPLYFNVTSKPPIYVITLKPVGQIVFVTTTTAPAPPVTTTQTAQQTTPVTQATQVTLITQVIPVPQTTSLIPASQSDTIPPVTTLAGTEDGSGGDVSDVICTLTATDNSGGSGVSVTQYSFDGTSWNTYSQPFPLDKTGPMVLYYRSSDNAGNTEVANVKAFAIGGPGAAAQTPGINRSSFPSSSDVPFYPLPLWLVGLILFILIAAIGGGLYLKSQQKKEEKK